VSPLYAILVIATIVLVILLTISIIAIWKRSRRKKLPLVKAVIRRESENTFESADPTPTKVDQNGLEEIGNPDVIPSKNGEFGFVTFFFGSEKSVTFSFHNWLNGSITRKRNLRFYFFPS